MNALYLDIGNTSLKLAVPDKTGWTVLWHQRFEYDFPMFIALLEKHAGDGTVVIYTSSVRKDIIQKIVQAVPDLNILVLTTSKIPMHLINYTTVDTLGVDRFLGCLGAFNKTDRNGVIVIDTGSACTVDFMDEYGVYQGGVIMPGLEILKKSIQIYLPELPEVDVSIPGNWPGKSTMDSLRWGVNGMFKVTVESWIQKYRLMDADAEVFITGGNSKEVQLLLPEVEFIHYNELQFEGMKVFIEEMTGRV